MSGLRLKRGARELLAFAIGLGFVFVRFTGSGHLLIRHENGETLTISCTPSDRRGDAIKKSEMRRVARGGKR